MLFVWAALSFFMFVLILGPSPPARTPKTALEWKNLKNSCPHKNIYFEFIQIHFKKENSCRIQLDTKCISFCLQSGANYEQNKSEKKKKKKKSQNRPWCERIKKMIEIFFVST